MADKTADSDVTFHRSSIVNPSVADVGQETFSVVTYNILAEVHRVRADYSYTDEKYLVQDYRHGLLMRELKYLDADIVCLQEVNPTYYDVTLQPAMEELGYSGKFIKKTREYFEEGEATFIKTARFVLENWIGLSLSQLMLKEVVAKNFSPDVEESIRRYLDRSEVVNICRLRCRRTSQVVTVGNVHVVWDDYKWPDVKALEIASAVKELVSQAGSDSSPHLLCGDFNCVPTSVGYQLAQDGYLSDSSIASLQAVNNLSLESGSKQLVTYLPDLFKHTSPSLSSVYSTCMGKEPEVTCYDRTSFGCLDYIWFNQSGLGVSEVLELPSESVLEATGGLPNTIYPSDHLSLKAYFFFRNGVSKRIDENSKFSDQN